MSHEHHPGPPHIDPPHPGPPHIDPPHPDFPRPIPFPNPLPQSYVVYCPKCSTAYSFVDQNSPDVFTTICNGCEVRLYVTVIAHIATARLADE